MKLKYNFVVRAVGGKSVAVAVGKDNALFNGMIKLNSSAEFLFKILNERDASEEGLVLALTEKYDISEECARETVAKFVENLRNGGLLEE